MFFSGDFGFTPTESPVGPSIELAGKFEGFSIYSSVDGFYWQEGGYFETFEECVDDISNWNARELRAEYERHTPSLEAPWWEHR